MSDIGSLQKVGALSKTTVKARARREVGRALVTGCKGCVLGETEMANLKERGAAPSTEAGIRTILDKPYWDYGEAALVLNVTTKTLRNMKWKREITFTKFGRKVYFPRDLIMKELKQNTVLCPATAIRGKPHAAGVGVA